MLFLLVNAALSVSPSLDFVRAAKRGDSRAWAVLFRQYQPALTAYCLACASGRRDLALDLTQDIFALAIANIRQLNDEARFQGWLFTLARNHCLRSGQRSAKEEEAIAKMSLLLCDEPPETAAERERWLQHLEHATQALPNAHHREIVLAHHGRGEKTREIAQRLATPHGTVTVVLMRFRNQLKRELLAQEADS